MAAAWTDGSCKGSGAGRPGTLCLAGSIAGRGDEPMTINPFDLTAIAGFMAVGLWYRDFSPVSDEQVREMLETPPASET